ncbi:MAG: tetratricopeptide repeat protein [Phormidesmis sp.]
MPEAELSLELTSLVDIDPFALIGISVSADEKRIAKRYRTIAKQLHPDALANASTQQGITPTHAAQIIARIVNPSYQKLKHGKSRQETLSTLRFRVLRLVRTEKLIPTFDNAQQLAHIEEDSLEVYYEQAIRQLAQIQFTTVDQLHACSLEIGQLNLVYLHRKTNATIRQKRAGLISKAGLPSAVDKTTSKTNASTAPASVSELNQGKGDGSSNSQEKSTSQSPYLLTVDYVAKHIERAKTYLRQRSYDYAIQELREALKLSPQNPEIHSMIGQAYYKQSLTGMAKAHFKQAYRLNPNHKVVKKYIELLGLSAELEKEGVHSGTSSQSEKTAAESSNTRDTITSKKAWLGRLLRR